MVYKFEPLRCMDICVTYSMGKRSAKFDNHQVDILLEGRDFATKKKVFEI